MKILVNLSALRRTRWSEHLLRFALGGAVTVIAGLIAKAFGPTVGGLFLAFPVIFPASATLLDKHEREKKKQAGIQLTIRGQQAVGLDARGAALGSLALGAFALLVWKTLPEHGAAPVLGGALFFWAVVAATLWRLRKLHVFLSRRR
jgi:Protein of unknown function (DUF3147)